MALPMVETIELSMMKDVREFIFIFNVYNVWNYQSEEALI
jgi:hypothetical protein